MHVKIYEDVTHKVDIQSYRELDSYYFYITAMLKLRLDFLMLHVSGAESKTNLSSPVHSDFSHRSNNAIPRTSSIHDLLEYQVITRQQLAPPMTTASKKLYTGQLNDNRFEYF